MLDFSTKLSTKSGDKMNKKFKYFSKEDIKQRETKSLIFIS